MREDILILGGGVAGMSAAIRVKELGLSPVIVERDELPGGHLKEWDRLFPDRSLAKESLDILLDGISGIRLISGATLVSAMMNAEKRYDVHLSNGTELTVSAIILATGFSLFPAEKKEEYGYGIYDHVITNAELEAFFRAGEDKRIDQPERVGFVHCVGSRDEKACNRQCSRVCCVSAVKQAIEIKEAFPNAQVYCFYMDLRMFGRGYEDLYLEAQSKYGIRFIRGRVSEASETQDGKVVIKAEDTLSSKPVKITLDLLVLMSGIVADSSNRKLFELLGMELGEDGFVNAIHPIHAPITTRIPGIFIAGTVSGPKSIPETINEAGSAAVYAYNYIKSGENG